MEKNMKYKAVVFDMDGVIFDSERMVYQAWIELADKYNLENMDEVYYQCIGVNASKTREIFLNYYGEDFPYEIYAKEASKWFHDRFDGGRLPLKSGIKEILMFLKENGYKIGLASSTRKAVVKQEIEDAGLLSFFDNLTCGDMLKKSKPEPDIFLMACESLGVLPQEAIAIEDSYNGIRAAYRAKMTPIMVPDMIAPDEEMKGLAHKICKDLNEVRVWLAEMH